jgi:Cap4 dsDNA endonuclease
LSIAPDQILDNEDPGDDVSLRFRYQHCHAAILALRMIVPGYDVEEIICENHEDILVRRKDGLFVAVQVKTRDLTQPPFKAKDEQIIKALARFVRLNILFPGSFATFELLTNHVFWEGEETDNNLLFLLNSLKARGSVKGLKKERPLRLWVARISADCGSNEDAVVAALLKTVCTSKVDTVESVKRDVVDALAECPGMGESPYASLRVMAGRLIEFACEASTKSKGSSVLALYQPGGDLQALICHQQLEAKRIRKSDVETIIKDALESKFETLCVDDFAPATDLPKTLSVLYQKLERGALETERVQQFEDLVRSVEALYLKWVDRYGTEEANRRMNDLKNIVQFDCTEAKVAAAKPSDEPYASAMYAALYKMVSTRCANNPDTVYKCRPEHLLGAAGILTQECKVWWSEKFKLAGTDHP